MSNFRILGPTCSTQQPKKSLDECPVRGPVGFLLAATNELFKLSEKTFGIPDFEGLIKLQKSYESSNGGHGRGLRVALGKWKGKPCMYEFETEATGWGLSNMKYTSTLKQRIPPMYLSGTKRECYLVGDIILIKKYTKSRLPKKFSGAIQDNRPGVVKFLSYILNEGEQKEYNTGYLIIEIKPNPDGSGKVTVQPVIFIGDTPIPVSYESFMGIGGMFHLRKHDTSHYDLPKLWGEEEEIHNSDLKKFVVLFSTTVAEYGMGSVKKIGLKIFKKIIAKKIEKELKSKLKQVLAMGTTKALSSFVTTFIKELEPHMSQKSLGKNSRQIIEKALLKSVGAALAGLFSEISGSGLEYLIPKEVVEGIAKRITRVIIGKYFQILEVAITKLFDLKADKIDLETGKSTKESVTTANNNYQAELRKVFTDVIKETENALMDFALGF